MKAIVLKSIVSAAALTLVCWTSSRAWAQVEHGAATAEPAAPATAAEPAAPVGEQIDSPFYKYWSKYGKGSSATYTMTMSAAGQTMNVSLTQTLSELTDDMATVETKQSMAGAPNNETPSTEKIPAKVAKDKEWTTPDGTSKLVPAGDEKVTVGGKEYACKKFTLAPSAGGPPITGTAYFSDEVPGGLVKIDGQVTAPDQAQSGKITVELQSIDKK
ncbi:MAG: hypothetical protein QM770_06195 [Tepidisphaeraceae bacterium]